MNFYRVKAKIIGFHPELKFDLFVKKQAIVAKECHAQ